jgi:hypothetical protein
MREFDNVLNSLKDRNVMRISNVPAIEKDAADLSMSTRATICSDVRPIANDDKTARGEGLRR